MPEAAAAQRGKRLHPLPLRVMHWVNAFAMIVMIGSGWRIYEDEPLFGWLSFPYAITLGGDPEVSSALRENAAAGALQWHFFGMWILGLNGLAYLAYGTVTGRFRRKLLPVRPREVLHEVGQALRFRLKHDDITVYNAVQRLLYIGVIVAVIVQVLAGLAIWKPIQLWWLTAMFGGFQGARLVHFLGMGTIVGFLVVHVALALMVPRTLLAMVSGGPRVKAPEQMPAADAATRAAPSALQPGE